jgi:hypothetical protein
LNVHYPPCRSDSAGRRWPDYGYLAAGRIPNSVFDSVTADENGHIRFLHTGLVPANDVPIERGDFDDRKAVRLTTLCFDCVDQFDRLGAWPRDEDANAIQWAISHARHRQLRAAR